MIAPDFNIRLDDPNVSTFMKVQVQINGVEQVASAMIATLHHQMIYRLHDHALDLHFPNSTGDVFMVVAARNDVLAIIQTRNKFLR